MSARRDDDDGEVKTLLRWVSAAVEPNRDPVVLEIPMPASALTSYKDLVSWQRAMELTVACYRFADTFPAEERFGLSSQLRRAAVSVPSNSAEGYGRRTRGDYLRSLSIARGSLMEVETQLLLADALRYGKAEDRDSALNLARYP